MAGMRAPLLGHTALLLSALAALSCGLTAPPQCPRSLDCARLGRHFCRHGNTHCGPCLLPLVENSRGRCVVRRRRNHHHETLTTTLSTSQHHRGDTSSNPELDEEIDILSAIITEHRTVTLTAPPSQEDLQRMVKGPTPSGPAPSTSATETSTSHSTSSSTPPTVVTNHSSALLSPFIQPRPSSDDSVFIVMSSVFIVTGSVALMIAGACWVRLQRGARLSQKLDYAPYGLRRPQNFENLPGDRKLVQSAQMFHYQHQRAQMLSLDRQRDSPRVADSGASTDDDNDDDFTVYECPGLAPTGEMEVKNPLFDDSTLYFHRFHK